MNQSLSPSPTHRAGRRDTPAQGRRSARWPRTSPLGRELWRYLGISDSDEHAGLRRRDAHTRRLLAAADALAAVFALTLVSALGGIGLPPVAIAAALPIVVAINKVAGLYDRDDMVLRRSTLDEVPSLLQLTGLYAIFASAVAQELSGATFQPLDIARVWLCAFGLMAVARAAAREIARVASAPERCLVVGQPDMVEKVVAKLGRGPSGAAVVATLPWSVPARANSAESLGIEALIRQHNVQRVVIVPATTDAGDTVDLIRIAKAAGVRVSILPRMFEAIGTSVEFEQVEGVTLLGVRRFGLTRSSLFVKRAFDLAVAGMGLIVAMPLLAAAALAVRLEGPGPIFFRQVRIGRDGRPFRIWKLRSMVDDAEASKPALFALNEAGSGMFKARHDPRITRVGRFLRQTSLDELPQLLNVVRGEMSVVGPRPLISEEDARIVGHHRSRLHLTPGMTGPWQVLGSTRVPLEEMVGIDYLYVTNWSLWMDVKILLRTVPHVFASRGL